ncbi:hypothetical protein NKJ71_09530 [Mesorhizobium sp. M0050]|uniref:hypothetical protein n=1 Tax=Mesorhizobium sp. M0050 TaxID=2956861 RepID=UPI00333C3B83
MKLNTQLGAMEMKSMVSFRDDSPELTRRDALVLRNQGVQKVLSIEQLAQLHAARLARFARNGVDRRLWGRLNGCNGTSCPNRVCSAACVFGERREINRLTREARRLLKGGERLWSVTIIDPNYFREPGRLGDFSMNGMFQALRRRIREAPANWATAQAVGAIDIAYNRERDGMETWAPHVHLVASIDAGREEIREVLKPRRSPPPNLVGATFRPVKAKPITNLANAISYAQKSTIDGRGAILDGRGNTDRRPLRVPDAAQLEHDIWLLGMRPRDRSFLSGAMVSRGGVVARKRG